MAAKQLTAKQRHNAYLFWAVVVIAANALAKKVQVPMVTGVVICITVFALLRLLSMDNRFHRVYKAFRTASSMRNQDGTFDNENLNSKKSK
ncbi:hypothetical protein FC50_GL000603 [Lacticaseibacillus pantheris DSM 15945 = JCM 12539 = NBRC 106106]|uniref:Uncharacterized protein n=1 Tax=Lacticaseibacillus pantheris DSM 15945 = JCM 12539 = NBRC 106106 TaxID=1423783 RepID=A0A0R1TZH5_9LACO|nr:hypothetical protein [Lacticaseibacillus pantheris]KRL86640.1 hypothetical protein FC50_GL000603 [Lacticaseibacillus pantheris DSM 15945 = JCM 12539 = NBRC 106106]